MIPVFAVVAGGAWAGARVPVAGPTVVQAAGLFAFAAQAYFWAGWAASCASAAASWSVGSPVPWLYHVVAFTTSYAPIGWFPHKEMAMTRSAHEQRGIQRGTVLYGIITMVAYIVFTINPGLRRAIFGWLVG